MRTIVAALWLATLAAPAVLGADDLQRDLRDRRARVMRQLGDRTILVLFSAPSRIYSLDIEYEYRQDSNLYYLTGIAQEDTILVLMPGNLTRSEILFVSPRDPTQEHWDGPRLSAAEATARSDIGTVYSTTEFEPFIDAVLAGRGDDLPAGSVEEYATFFEAQDSNHARVALAMDPSSVLEASPDPAREFGARLVERDPELTLHDARPALAELRRVKSTYEQELLVRSVAISSEAHRAGMRVAAAAAYEHEVEAAIEHVFLARGGLGWAYPSIVGSGPNATILHYDESRRRMNAGELLLVDAGVNYQYMSSDITRTYPVDGTFSAAQREIYEVVLSAQLAASASARRGVSLTDLHQKSVEVVKAGLLRLGLITDATGDQYRLWFTHGTCHYIGLDVHDVGDEAAGLEPGVAFVIEPGIYIRPDVLDRLPEALASDDDFIASVRPAVERYRNIGVRVEDSFLFTEQGIVRLSHTVPRSVEEIESFLSRSGADDR